MNEERVRKLVHYLKSLDARRFRMEHWLIPVDAADHENPYLYSINSLEELDRAKASVPEGRWCGTAGCIAGHACMLFPDEGRDRLVTYHHIPTTAARILDLTHEEQNYLFTPTSIDLEDVTLSLAIMVLEHFLETGEIDWTLNAGD